VGASCLKRAMVAVLVSTVVAGCGGGESPDGDGAGPAAGRTPSSDNPGRPTSEGLASKLEAFASAEGLRVRSCHAGGPDSAGQPTEGWTLGVIDPATADTVAELSSSDVAPVMESVAPGVQVDCTDGLISPDGQRIAVTIPAGDNRLHVGWVDLRGETLVDVAAEDDEGFTTEEVSDQAPRFDAEGRLWFAREDEPLSYSARLMWADSDGQVSEGRFTTACGFPGWSLDPHEYQVVGDVATGCQAVQPSGRFAAVTEAAVEDLEYGFVLQAMDPAPPRSDAPESDSATPALATVDLVGEEGPVICRPSGWVDESTLLCWVEATTESGETTLTYRTVEVDVSAFEPDGQIGPLTTSPPVVPETDRPFFVHSITDLGEIYLVTDPASGGTATLYRARTDQPGEPEKVGELAPPFALHVAPHDT
jgi:hypothetical protein